eukprot:2092862-Pleurochrysis_carterae.AAC.1
MALVQLLAAAAWMRARISTASVRASAAAPMMGSQGRTCRPKNIGSTTARWVLPPPLSHWIKRRRRREQRGRGNLELRKTSVHKDEE